MQVRTAYENVISDNRIKVGDSYITRRERDVAQLYASGLRQIDIAKALRMSRKTVSTHIRNMRFRLQVQTIAQLIAVITEAKNKELTN